MKKLINILVLILIIGTLLLSVVACEKEQEIEKPTFVKYSMEQIHAKLTPGNIVGDSTVDGKNSLVTIISNMITDSDFVHRYYQKKATIYSSSILDNDVTVTYVNGYDANSREEKALITSKWLYYASLLVNSNIMRTLSSTNKPYKRVVYDISVPELVGVMNSREGYVLLEEVALMPYHHPKYDEYIEAYGDPIGKGNHDIILNGFFEEMYYQYEMLPVVLTKYNLWNTSQEIGKVGSVLMKDGADTDENGGWSEYKVIGYYETSVDKLLPMGILMGSNDYYAAMEQLRNPTYYAMYNLAETIK